MLNEALKKIGLSDKEAAVYLASLQVGSQPVSIIAKKADLNRSTTYLILDQLKKKGLVSQYAKAKVKYYYVVPPEQLLIYLDRLQQELSDQKTYIGHLIPQFHNLLNPNIIKPKVRFYEGFEGIKSVYRELFDGPEILAYVSLENIAQYLPENVSLFKKKVNEKNISLKEILEDSKVAREYAKSPFNKHHKVRILPFRKLRFFIDYLIFGYKVAIITFKDPPIAVVIENRDLADTERAIFALAWRGAKKVA